MSKKCLYAEFIQINYCLTLSEREERWAERSSPYSRNYLAWKEKKKLHRRSFIAINTRLELISRRPKDRSADERSFIIGRLAQGQKAIRHGGTAIPREGNLKYDFPDLLFSPAAKRPRGTRSPRPRNLEFQIESPLHPPKLNSLPAASLPAGPTFFPKFHATRCHVLLLEIELATDKIRRENIIRLV